MTDAELQEILHEAGEHARKTSFPAPADDEYEAHGHHPEFGENRH